MTSDHTEAARRAIGDGAPDDYLLAPENHASDLGPEAGALARVLRRKSIELIIIDFRAKDRAAIKSQAKYKRLSKLAVYLRLAPVIIGAFLLPLTVSEHLEAALRPSLQAIGFTDSGRFYDLLMFLEFLALFLAVVASVWLRVGRYFEKWMRNRTAAETTRLQFFYRITGAREPLEPNELPLAPLQLEYFRRYQLDVQRSFCRIRARQNAEAAGQTERAGLIATFLILITFIPTAYGAVRLFSPEWLPDGLSILQSNAAQLVTVALGIVAAGVGSAIAEISKLSLHQRNAARYTLVSQDLEAFAGHPLDQARAAAATNDRDAVNFFIDTVQGVVSSENQEWIQLWRLRQSLQLGRD